MVDKILTGDPTPVVRSNIDIVANSLKADLDANVLPPDAVIKDVTMAATGMIQATIVLDAGGNIDTANTLLATITTNLRNLNRPFTTIPRRRRDDGNMLNKLFVIQADRVIYHITNF